MSMTPKAPTPAPPDTLTAARVAAAPVDEVIGWVDSSAQGLSSAEVSARRARYGPNAVRTHHVNAFAVLGRQLRSAVLILLAGTAAVSYFLGDSLQAIIIGVILAASIGLGFINEYRAERAAAALHSGVRHTAVARRDGAFTAIDVTELVPGDVIRLSLGEAVPADLRLIEVTGLECNESILTGESMGSEKSPQPVPADAELAESADLAFMGTIVSAGEGTGVVYATGRSAEFGRIAAGLGERQPETDFQVGLRKFSYLLLQVAIALTVLILVSNLLLRKPVIDSVLFSLAIAVGITPQLLPAVVSASLATGSRQLAKAKVLVKRLVCIEDLGDIDILITDKTGTLTEGRISLVDAVSPAGAHSDSVLRLGLLATDVDPESGGVGANALDAALWESPQAKDLVGAGVQRVASVPFDHIRRATSVLVDDAGKRVLVLKGAPEQVLARCQSMPGCGAGHPGRAVRRRAPGGRGGRQTGRRADHDHRRGRVRSDVGRVRGLRRRTQGRRTRSPWLSWRRWASRSRSPPATTPGSPKRSAPIWVWRRRAPSPVRNWRRWATTSSTTPRRTTPSLPVSPRSRRRS